MVPIKYNKKELKAKETRKRIRKAAVRLFARQGYHKTTIADIAQAIDLTSGAIFHHFPSKDAILEEVVEGLSRGIRVYSEYTERAEGGSLKLLKGVIGIMCDHFRRNPEATICLAALATEFAGSSHPMESRIKDIYEVFVEAFTRIFENHPAALSPRTASIALVGAVQGIAVQGLLREREESIDQLAESFVGLFADW
jgi:AcrR family transcriptional regulator